MKPAGRITLTDDQETHPEGVLGWGGHGIFYWLSCQYTLLHKIWLEVFYQSSCFVFFFEQQYELKADILYQPYPLPSHTHTHTLPPPTRLFLRFSLLSQEVWPQLSTLCYSTCHSARKPRASNVSGQSGVLFHLPLLPTVWKVSVNLVWAISSHLRREKKVKKKTKQKL